LVFLAGNEILTRFRVATHPGKWCDSKSVFSTLGKSWTLKPVMETHGNVMEFKVHVMKIKY